MDTLYCPTTGDTLHGELHSRYMRVRRHTQTLITPLTPEDMVAQSMADASPVKWHLGHTTWFFETFILSAHILNIQAGYQVFNADFGYVFNSYYEALGPRQPREKRGLLTRPALDEVLAYRRHVDDHMGRLLSSDMPSEIENLVALGLAHEQQHQELLCMDVLHLFAQSPLKPAYDSRWPVDETGRQGQFRTVAGGLVEIGADGDSFAFDNERPRHKAWLEPFEISDRLVTNAEWLAFMADGGYRRAEWWLSDGWAQAQAEGWEAPLYWERSGAGWSAMSLRGLHPVEPDAGVTHISYYEANAFANWAGARLPTEAEWEQAASLGMLQQVDEVAWQWTSSAYSPYPGFQAALSAVGEYNGKFMVGQMVLRGGASVTPEGHSRLTYRNFFHPDKRWMVSGVRLARNASATNNDFAADVIAGLSAHPKSLSPKYFYDAAGSDLFEAICELPEYYPTRMETTLLHTIAPEIAADIPDSAVLVEFGSGASAKTRAILDAAPQISAYVPIDISVDALDAAAARLKQTYPHLKITSVAADFTADLSLPKGISGRPVVGFFPGSTIGNFTPVQAVQFLRSVRRLLGKDALLIVGADMVKDQSVLVAAYDDAQGVTAKFNKNLLVRINRELNGNFDPGSFDHLAVWNAEHQRMEMHLVSRTDQIVTAAGHSFAFTAGERFHTENSHKFTLSSFAKLAADAGWKVARHWISPAPEFAVFSLRA